MLICMCVYPFWLISKFLHWFDHEGIGWERVLLTHAHTHTQRPSLFVSLLVIRAQPTPKGVVCSRVLKLFSKNCCMKHPPLGYKRV